MTEQVGVVLGHLPSNSSTGGSSVKALRTGAGRGGRKELCFQKCVFNYLLGLTFRYFQEKEHQELKAQGYPMRLEDPRCLFPCL